MAIKNINLNALTNAQGFQILGANSRNYIGGAVNGLGDINGDGIDDITIGSFLCCFTTFNYVIYGKSTGFRTIDLRTFNTTQGFNIINANGYTGGSSSQYALPVIVKDAGDINGDGIDDIIIGASNAGFTNLGSAGESYIIFGNKNWPKILDLSTLTIDQGFKIFGESNNGQCGYSVDSAGDINGDGLADVIIGAPVIVRSSYVIYGTKNNFSNIYLNSISTNQEGFQIVGSSLSPFWNFFGFSVSKAGDVNGDGLNDVIIGRSSASYVVYGNTNNTNIDASVLNIAQGFVIENSISSVPTDSGNAVSNVGDINGDGLGDVITSSAEGIIYVIYGQRNIASNINVATLTNGQGFQIINSNMNHYGMFASYGGDINGDGIDDIIINGYCTATERCVHVIYGKRGGIGNIDLSTLAANQGSLITTSSTALVVNSAGDVNGDGMVDIIIGAPSSSPLGRNTAGSGYVIFNDCVIDYSAFTSAVNLNMSAGNLITRTHIVGSYFSDHIIGNNLNNNIEGGPGADLLNGGGGVNFVSYISSSAAITVSLTAGIGIGGDADGDVISNFQNILGSGFADTLIGDVNVNNLQGGAGNDIIEGKAGADVLDGGVGIDTVSYASSTAGVTVNLATNTVSGGDATGDSISNFENILGSGFADILTGDVNTSSIQGGAGDDILKDGGGGNVVLTGGVGTDIFVISTASGTVTITDFSIIDADTIDISSFNLQFTQIMAAAQNNGNNCEITLRNKDLIIENTNTKNLQESWFKLTPTTTPFASPPTLYLGLTQSQLIGILSSVISGSITVGGVIYKSYKYYDSERLGHNHYYSYIASKVPTMIWKTTAAILQNAEDAQVIAANFQKNFQPELVTNEIRKAFVRVIETCDKAIIHAKDMGPTTVEVAKSTGVEIIDMAAKAVERYTTFRDTFVEFIKTHPTAVSSAFQAIISNSPSIVPQAQTEMVKQSTGTADGGWEDIMNPLGMHNVGAVEN